MAMTAAIAGCTYNKLSPEAKSVVATSSRPPGTCKHLGNLTGKGGGSGGG